MNSNDFFEEEDLENVSFEKNSSFLNEKYKNSVEEKFKSLMKTIQETECLNQIQIEDFENDFYIDLEELQETRNLTKLEKKEQIERRVNECKPLADIIFKYLVGLKNRITGVRKTEKEMTEKYGEFDEFFMERRKV